MNPPEACVRGFREVSDGAKKAVHFYGRGDLFFGGMAWFTEAGIWRTKIYVLGFDRPVGELALNTKGECVAKTGADELEKNIKAGLAS